jgi:hypothetical protein
MPEGLEGHIIDFESRGDSIKFLYYGDIQNAVEPVYEESAVRGRSEEHIFYSHTGAETYNFEIRLAASVDERDGGTTRKIHDDYLFIKSFAYPDYGTGLKGPVKPPRKAIITIGTWFNKPGVIKSPNGTFVRPFDANGFPYIIDVTFTFRVVSPTPRDLFDIRAGLL